MTTLTKADIINILSESLGINLRESREIAESFFEEIRLALENGHEVKISGFGNFTLRDKRARPGRNPKTGKDATITARRVVTFHVGQKLKAKLAQYHGEEKI